jgi:hypothetical protein
MMLSAALDSGLAFGVVVIFFGIVYPGWMSGFKWWGTEVYKQVSRTLLFTLSSPNPIPSKTH